MSAIISINKFYNKFILVFNLFVYRIDSFLYNFFESILLIAYSIVFLKSLGLFVNSEEFFTLLMRLPVILHLLYMISYIINDVIDYSSDSSTRKTIDPLFYDLRPIYYFKCSKFIIAYTLILYLLYLSIISYSIQGFLPLIYLLIVTIVLLSFLHSICQNILILRIITFSFMRLFKYILLIVILNMTIFRLPLHPTTFWIIISLIIPLTVHSTLGYSKNFKNLKFSIFFLSPKIKRIIMVVVWFIFILLIFFSFSFFVNWNILRAIIIGHLLITLPAFCISRLCLEMSKLIFGNRLTYYSHLWHISFTTMLFLIKIIVIILNFL